MSKTLKEMKGANMNTRQLHKHLKDRGWEKSRTSGGHDVYTHPKSTKNIAVPRHKDIKAPVVLGIMKTAQQLGEEFESMEKVEMAQTQLHFIKYAAEEILDYLDDGGKIEEWYQNKLSKAHSDMEGMHSWVEGEKRRVGMVDESIAKIARHYPDHWTKEQKREAGKKASREELKRTLDSMKDVQDLAVQLKNQRDRKLRGEETEHLDEISKKTLGSYIKKASDDVSNLAYSSGRRKMDDPEAIKLDRKDEKRRDNIAKATDRLTREETENLDEVSMEKLTRYKTAASKSASEADKAGDYAKGNKRFSGMIRATKKQFDKTMKEEKKMKDEDPCWKGYEMVGKKKKNGKEVPNCVPVKEQIGQNPYEKYHEKSPYHSDRMAKVKQITKTAKELEKSRLGKGNRLNESRRTEIVREALQKAKNKNKKKVEDTDKFEPDPELSTAINKTDV